MHFIVQSHKSKSNTYFTDYQNDINLRCYQVLNIITEREVDRYSVTFSIYKMKMLTNTILVVTLIIPSYFSNAGKVLFYSPISTKSYRILYNPILKELER